MGSHEIPEDTSAWHAVHHGESFIVDPQGKVIAHREGKRIEPLFETEEIRQVTWAARAVRQPQRMKRVQSSQGDSRFRGFATSAACWLTASKKCARAEFQALIWDHFVGGARARSWFPESSGPNVIYAAVNAQQHDLRVSLRYDASSIHTEIIESQNLRQSERRIHAKALSWIGKLQERIRRELGRMSFAGRPGA